MEEQLTLTQNKILDFLRSSRSDPIPPTVREICAATGIKSTSSVHSGLCVLEQKGFIERNAGRNRSIRLAQTVATVSVPLAVELKLKGDTLEIVRKVASIPFPYDYSHGSEQLFAVRVDNERLEHEGILDGDIVICCFCRDFEQNGLAVALSGQTPYVFFSDKSQLNDKKEQPQPETVGKVIACIRFYG